MIGTALAGNAQKEGVYEIAIWPVTPTIHATATPGPTEDVGRSEDGAEPVTVPPDDGEGHLPEESVGELPPLDPPADVDRQVAGQRRLDNSVEADFFAGYRDGGGTSDEEHIWRVINCESLWRPWVNGAHLGLAQFSYGTWANVSGRTGLTDWSAPYHQGYNVAVWSQLVDPGSAAGWPVCWYS